jgi:hypothetical protein
MKWVGKAWQSAAARRITLLSGITGPMEKIVAVVAQRFLEGIACPPTDLDALMQRLNVHSAIPDELLPFSGELQKDCDGFRIAYAASLPVGRRRFTIAHELGHAVFESTGPNCPRTGQELERICDMLASEFLFPRDPFLAAAGPTPDVDSLLNISRQFQASLMATALRCHKLFGISFFQVDDGKLGWGYGAIRSDISLHEGELRRLVIESMAGRPGESLLYLSNARTTEEWLVRWKCLHAKRAVFSLCPTSRVADKSPFRHAK